MGELVGQGGDVGEPGLGAEVVAVGAVGAEDAKEVAELAEGLAAGAFDVAHGIDGRVEVVAGDGLGRAGLDGHHRDLVGDDVVELAGDAGSFVGDGLAGPSVLVGLEPFGAFLEEGQVVAAVADPATHDTTGVPVRMMAGAMSMRWLVSMMVSRMLTAIAAATMARLWRWSAV